MRLLLLLTVVLQVSLMHGQHTQHFNELTKDLKSKKMVSFQNFYVDGSLKEEGNSRAYKMPEYTYRRTSGTFKTYYKTGELKSESELDRLGNVLNAVYYNADGTTWWKAKTIQIDSKLTSSRAYFLSTDHLLISKEIKEYKFSNELGAMYLRAEGSTLNSAKSGTWKYYDADGRLEEEVIFK